MANNRLWLVAVNDEGGVLQELLVAKHLGGQWYLADGIYESQKDFCDRVDAFLMDAFMDGCGIALKDDYMDVPLPPIYAYNKLYTGDGRWVFIKEKEDE